MNLREQMREVSNNVWERIKDEKMKPIYDEIYKTAEMGKNIARVSEDLLSDYKTYIWDALIDQGFKVGEWKATKANGTFTEYYLAGIIVQWELQCDNGNGDIKDAIYTSRLVSCRAATKTKLALEEQISSLYDDIIKHIKYHAELGWRQVTITREYTKEMFPTARREIIARLQQDGFYIRNSVTGGSLSLTDMSRANSNEPFDVQW